MILMHVLGTHMFASKMIRAAKGTGTESNMFSTRYYQSKERMTNVALHTSLMMPANSRYAEERADEVSGVGLLISMLTFLQCKSTVLYILTTAARKWLAKDIIFVASEGEFGDQVI